MLTTGLAPFLIVALAAPPAMQAPRPQRKATLVTVYRTPTCGCCSKWIQHLKSAGFDVDDHVIDNLDAAPGRARIPEPLRSCHTATVAGFAVEGHVPADVIKDLLKRKPQVAGIAVPGMPAGSPGMESPNPQSYEVIAFDLRGRTSTFAKR